MAAVVPLEGAGVGVTWAVVVGVLTPPPPVVRELEGVESTELISVETPGGFKPLAILLNWVIKNRSPTPKMPFLI